MDESLIQEIHFNENDLQLLDYERLTWKIKETRIVEFFPKVFFPVTLISTEIPEFENYLNDLVDNLADNESDGKFDESKIAMDLEWEDELCLFQFCSSKKVLIVRHPNGPGNEILQKFLSTHSFFAKGASNDKKQLKLKFGEDFHQNIEDIAQTRLAPYGFSENFMQMTYQFAGKPTADFKDIRITTSNWSQKNLTMRQVLYAAFDVVAIYQCYPNFPPSKILTKPQKQQKNHNQAKNQNKKKQKISKSSNKSNNIEENNTEKIKITMKSNYVRPTFCYMITNYIGSTLRYDLYDLVSSIVEIENINFISAYPESNSKLKEKEIGNPNDLKNEKYKEIEPSFDNKIHDFLNKENEKEIYERICKNNDSFMIFISLFKDIDIKKLIEVFPKFSQISKLPFVDPEESSDGDFLYITNIPQNLSEKSNLENFLDCFEIDHRLKIIETSTTKQSNLKKSEEENENNYDFIYARIEVCCASSSHNLKCFVPFVTIDKSNMRLFTFPYFLNSIVACNFPPTFNEDDCRRMFTKFGKIYSIRTLIRRSDEDNNQFVITYNQDKTYSHKAIFDSDSNNNDSLDKDKRLEIENIIRLSLNANKSDDFINNDPCELAIKALNYTKIDGNEILISRFAEEHHTRTMRRYEIAVSLKESYIQQYQQQQQQSSNFNDIDHDNDLISSKKLRTIFSNFGEIHQAYFDKRLLVGHVQFYTKSSAFTALDYFNGKKLNATNDKQLNADDFDVLKKYDIFFPPEGSTIIVRDVSCSMPQEEIIRMCEMYGRVINFVVRLIIPKFRYQIVEVSYNDVADAAKAKKELDNRRIDNLPIVVSVFRGAGCEVPMWKMEQRYQWIVVDGIALKEPEIREKFEKFGSIIDYEIFGQKRKRKKETEKKEESTNKSELKDEFLNFDENETEINKKQKTLIMFNDPRSAEAAIEAFTTTTTTTTATINTATFTDNNNGNSEVKINSNFLIFEVRYTSLHEFAFDVRWNRLALQTEAFVPFKNTTNEAQQLAIVIDPIPPGFTQQWLKKQCPKCFYTLAVTRSAVSPSNGRRAVIFIEGMKMTKKIFALIRNQRCNSETEISKNGSENDTSNLDEETSDENSKEKSEDEEENENENEKLNKTDKIDNKTDKIDSKGQIGNGEIEDADDDDEVDVLHPVIMSREEALRGGVVVGAGGNDVVHSPISIIIDPLPEELSTAKKIRTNILMGKEADIDIFESASEKGKLMGVVLPKLKEDCKLILRKFRRWRVDGLPLNVKKIINSNDDSSSF